MEIFNGYTNSSAGFGSEKTLYGHLYAGGDEHNLQFYLVSDVFKKFYPEIIDVILAGTSGEPNESVYEHIAIPPLGEQPQNASKKNAPYYFEQPKLGSGYWNSRSAKHRGGREIMFFPSEKTSLSMQLSHGDDNELLIKKILGYRAFNAIVIPEIYIPSSSDYKVMTQAEILKRVIEIQDELLPKEEQIPCYSTDGKCIYNPLKNLPPKKN